MVGTLPLYPTYPGDPSPYLPVSKLAWNELYVEPLDLPELERSPEARQVLDSPAWAEAVTAARQAVLVDYPAVLANQRRVLEPLARTLFSTPSARRDELERFVEGRPELAAYARFRAAGDVFGTAWSAWPGSRAGRVPDTGVSEDDVHYHLYAQWAAEHQLAAASRAGTDGPGAGRPGLYLDYPIGVHPSGFDPWWSPGSFASGVHGGAPPDDFFAGGQDWAFPPVHPEAERRLGYRYTRAALDQALRHAAVLRVDHVMGLHRLYWIPTGFDGAHGAYVRYPDDELRAIVAVEADRAGASVVGEDLGTVPDEVRQHMATDGMLRSWVFQFEASPEDPLADPPELSLASLGTHDLPRFAAFWSAEDVDEREAAGQIDRVQAERARTLRAELRRAVLGALSGPTVSGSAPAPETPARHRPTTRSAGPSRGTSGTWRPARPGWSWSTWRTCGWSVGPRTARAPGPAGPTGDAGPPGRCPSWPRTPSPRSSWPAWTGSAGPARAPPMERRRPGPVPTATARPRSGERRDLASP